MIPWFYDYIIKHDQIFYMPYEPLFPVIQPDIFCISQNPDKTRVQEVKRAVSGILKLTIAEMFIYVIEL